MPIVLMIGCASTPQVEAPAVMPPIVEVPADESWRKEMPKPGQVDPRRKTPTFHTEVLPNGLTIMFLRIEGLPIASLRVATIGGASTDPVEQSGLTFLTYGSLRDGAGSLEASGFERALEKLGVILSMEIERDYGSFELAGQASVANGMVRLLADAVIRPKLEDKALLGRRDRHAKKLGARAGGPLAVAGDRLPGLLFGDHPYGHAVHGTIESMKRIDPAAIRRHHPAVFRPERSALIIVGELELESLRPLIAHHFGRWQPAGRALTIDPPAARAGERRDVALIHRDNVSQAFVCLGRAVPSTIDPVAVMVMNQIFGGAFNSRLQLVLRETKGWTYGASSAFTAYRAAGELIACTQVERSAAAEAVQTMLAEAQRMAEQPPTDAEIRSAVLGLTSSLYGHETISAMSSLGAQSFARNRGVDHLTRREAELASLSPDAVRRAAAELLQPSQIQIVIVANARGLREELEALGLGTVALSR